MLKKVVWTLLVPLLVIKVTALNAHSPPGEPSVSHCRSYEKETFTCWWKPGPDGGLPTNYTLLYWTEKDKTQVECPDYRTSGPNSCYFSKAHSSIWMYYFVIVNASNALGWNASKLFDFEIVDIVQPYSPRNLSFSYEGDESSVPYLLVKWAAPEKADVKIGWMTLEYQVRLREEKKQIWEEHRVERHTKLKVFSLTPGKNYVVQVRCKADTGKWSEWSEEGYIQIPGVTKKRDLTLWVSIAVLSVIICLTMIWTMALKGCNWMSCICPPIPGPKIMGFDTQLLKSGKSEDLLGALGCQGFPPTSDCEDLLVEFLEVDDSKEHLASSPEREPQCQHMKVSSLEIDDDSGRGSCDSPFSHSEGIKDQRVQSQGLESIQTGVHDQQAPKFPWAIQKMDSSISDFNDNQLCIRSHGNTSSNQSPKSTYHNATDVYRLPLIVMNGNMSKLAMPPEDKRQPMYFRTIENIDEENSNKQKDFGDLHSRGGAKADMLNLLLNEKMPFMAPRTMDYVEVHKVNQNSALALIPKHKESNVITDQYSVLVPNQEYSKVERVEANSALVLMQNLELQVSPLSGGDAMKEFIQKSQQNQAEKLMGFIKPVIKEGDIKNLGMGYMDPSNFLP